MIDRKYSIELKNKAIELKRRGFHVQFNLQRHFNPFAGGFIIWQFSGLGLLRTMQLR